MWIDVKEQEPPVDEPVLGVDMREAFPDLSAQIIWFNYEKIYAMHKYGWSITHWAMIELPAPPELKESK